MAVDYVEDPIDHLVAITIDRPSDIHLALSFSADPTHFYLGGTPTVASLSVVGLPPLDPSTFKVNLPEGVPPPPFVEEAFYGGSAELTIPDGSGTLFARWFLEQRLTTGAAAGQVSYQSEGSTNPFFGANALQIAVVMQLRPLSFFETGSEDNHYEWTAAAVVTGIVGVEPIPAQSGRAESAQTLTFVINVTRDPPSASFSAG